jgi:hypothetical protein
LSQKIEFLQPLFQLHQKFFIISPPLGAEI